MPLAEHHGCNLRFNFKAPSQTATYAVLLAVTAGHLINDTLQGDRTSISFVFHLCAFLPAIGLLAMFLPGSRELRRAQAAG